LTPDLLPVRRKNGELLLSPIVGKARQKQVELAAEIVEIAANSRGMSREQLQSELGTVGQTPAESRIARGFAKLIEDATAFEQDRGRGAVERREVLFEHAAAAWRSLAEGQRFNRECVLARTAATIGVSPIEIEQGLFVDLPSAQRVLSPVTCSAEELVHMYEQARVAAVLLRATAVRATFRISDVLGVRALFRTLKFRQLMFEVERLTDGRHRLTLTGPYSLFESVTKYGLQLALCWPQLSELDDLELEADLRWGKKNENLRFTLHTAARSARTSVETRVSEVSDEVSELRMALQVAAPDAVVSEGEAVLELPGVGLCVPDLAFGAPDGCVVYIEVLGYWSRQALWRRVELVENGLIEPVLFIASSRLRVSEDVLDDDATGSIFVYRGRISPLKVLNKLNVLLERQRSRQRLARPSKSRHRGA
jgi:uncharacterized protein